MSERTLGDYRLLQELGEGAAGKVWLATPSIPKPFAAPGDPLAIKEYKPEALRRNAQWARIRREFDVGSRVIHPGLVEMLEYSLDPTSRAPFLVMRYIDGAPLGTWTDMFHPVPSGLVLHMIDQLLLALAELHAVGVIHRDIKPQNVLVAPDFRVVLMDFGVVAVSGEPKVTFDHEFVGTVRYSSPEFLFGKDYDARSDLYSLGTVLYRLLHGRDPFARNATREQVALAVRDDVPEYDTSRASDDPIRASLMALARRLLSKDPRGRPDSAEDARQTLTEARALAPAVEASRLVHGYLATALTGLGEDAREAIQFVSSKIAEVGKRHGVFVYEPRKASDPLLHSELSPEAVHLMDRGRVSAADVLLVVATHPSFGVGQELEIATSYTTPTILILRDGVRVSRMVTGGFLNLLETLSYATPEDLDEKLHLSLAIHLDYVHDWKRRRAGRTRITVGARLQSLRVAAGFSSGEDLARAARVPARLVNAIEARTYENPSTSILSHLAAALGVPPLDLLAVGPLPEVVDARVDENLGRLDELARIQEWSASDYIELRDDYLLQLRTEGEDYSVDDAQWMRRHEALARRKYESRGRKRDDAGLHQERLDLP